ncbi:helix-turn-helix transcriptional regulator [Brevibacillus laterosporus]|uniref:helix-turn-helix transcriptional regulator n=1 Tax=Brevibacillus laterosporus TaxID=1465 RepID=UPI003D1BABAF
MTYYQVGRCRLGVILKEIGMSQQFLAIKVELSIQQISNYVNNHQKMSLENAINIARVVNRPVDDLYELIPLKSRHQRQE